MNEYFSYEGNLSFRDYVTKTFSMMTLGLAITTITSLLFSLTGILYTTFGLTLMMVSIIGELGLAIYLTARIEKLSRKAASTSFVIYAILNGISLSSIFAVYELGSVVIAFGMTTVLFASMAIIGSTTKVDLTKFNSLFRFGLIFLLISSIVSFFITSSRLEWFITIFGIILFLGLTAFDIQRLRNFYSGSFSNSELAEKLVIIGALELYLDFINLFLRILRLFGRRKD